MSLPGRRGTRTLPDARSRSRAMCPTHERTTRWQVSWLADRRFLAAFPEKSPVACGPQAPGLQLRVQPRNCTEFPLGRPTGQRHLLALSENGQAPVNSLALPFPRRPISRWTRLRFTAIGRCNILPSASCLFGRLPGEISSGLWASSSRLTVAGTASELHRVPSWPPYRAAPSACIVGKWPGMCQLALPCGGASVYAYKPFGRRGATSGP